MVIILRSIIFNIVFFSTMFVLLVLFSPLALLDKKYTFIFWNILSKILDYITQHIAGIKYNLTNTNILRSNKISIFAMRHESTWETLIMIQHFKNPVFVLKKELIDIPFFGLLAKKVGSISIDRNDGVKSLIRSAQLIETALNEGSSVIIFPEGTRAQTGNVAEIKRGIAFFYKQTSYAVIPIVHNSGKFWPRRGFVKKPGTINVMFLQPIEKGLSTDQFMTVFTESFNNALITINQ